jgi:hypothetical protein
MLSEYFKNCRKGWIWTFVIHFKKQLTIFYLDKSRTLTSHMIEFSKIISEKKIVNIPKIIDFIINFNMSKTTPCIFQRGSFVQNRKSSIQRISEIEK